MNKQDDMNEKFNIGCLIGAVIMVLIYGWQKNNAQSIHETGVLSSSPVISRISVLSIHVRDTLVHDSVFHFLSDKLGLSVEYYPVKYMDRRYAGVYAGNMFLEPCGPFSNFQYASNRFKAIFFGLNCESEKSISSLAEDLTSRNIRIKPTGTIQIIDTTFITQNIYLNMASGNTSNLKREDSLRTEMLRRNKNALGIETIKEIWVGYSEGTALIKWKQLIEPSVLSPEGMWKINEDQSIRLVKSSINEVIGIVFRVRSLKKAKSWLIENDLIGDIRGDEIELDKLKTFGLKILLSE